MERDMNQPVRDDFFGPMLSEIVRALIEEAHRNGYDTEKVARSMSAAALMSAAQLHSVGKGSHDSFMRMAQRSLSLASTGVIEQ